MKSSISFAALAAPITLSAGAVWADDMVASWDLLAAILIEEIVTDTTYEVRKIFPAAVENGIDQFDITGYVVPLTNGPEITDFILVSDMGFCPFCGSPEHGTSLQVTMADPLTGFEEGSRITLRGALQAVTDPETWQTTVMTDARAL
ncbi:hypothetical protein OAN307_c21230 [Octadecabacter antarcticus 307]|uniref:DUF3299 domain-containing protein n=1 Tax=Octadecabacter antarcticus 307 TaxID=391626 RepID=M9RD46_9RHOB|nr:hypothetical protein [Octadecabacter antarcticus]AGI67755.1 hypothetical protein OAN307_c21230 [Octadecabacter antarcticus 307]